MDWSTKLKWSDFSGASRRDVVVRGTNDCGRAPADDRADHNITWVVHANMHARICDGSRK